MFLFNSARAVSRFSNMSQCPQHAACSACCDSEQWTALPAGSLRPQPSIKSEARSAHWFNACSRFGQWKKPYFAAVGAAPPSAAFPAAADLNKSTRHHKTRQARQKTPLLRTPLRTPLRPAGPVRGPSLASFFSEASALTTPERRRGTAPPRSGHKPTRVHNSQELGGVLSGRLRSPVRNFWFCLDTLATRRCFLRNPSAGARAFPELPRLPIAKRRKARATPNAPKPSFGKAARNAAMCGSADATKTLPAPRVAVHCGSWLGASRSASRLWNVPVSVASPPLAGVLGQRSWGMLPQEDEGAVRPNPEAVAALESTDAHDLHRTCQNACTSIYLAT